MNERRGSIRRMKPRHAQGSELEVYFVYSQPIPSESVVAPLPGMRLEAFPHDDQTVRSVRCTGDADPPEALKALRGWLASGQIRWLELGLRGYGLIDGKREYRPWRKNAHLSLAQLLALETLEPEIRYHAPI